MSDRELDPEVLADLRLRAATERERGHLRDAPMPTWQPPKIVDRVPCRGRCGNLVDWTDAAEERVAVFNRRLLATREAPIDKTRVVFCSACSAKGREMAAENNTKKADAM